ncbi:MAG TPA: RuBisCO large subunit C-terminal-like domain-containing protein [Chloroflexota bacterium]|nr:RuBisCO large subunit C-terminal-like domain-containing protein [Chloroflexota bacterium]
MIPSVAVPTSGERFRVVYRVAGAADEAAARARELCLEQTVEIPDELVPNGGLREVVVGRLESLERLDEGAHRATVSYAVEATGGELPQLLNVVFGNTSLKPGVRVERLELAPSLLAAFRGPRFGRAGLRRLLGAPDRPLFCTALKPLGLGPRELAEQAHAFALGGIDVVKDDHGLADQPWAPFEERVARCAEAIAAAGRLTGRPCLYAPNVTAPADRLLSRAQRARALGAGALLVAPGLLGWDAVRCLAEADALGLPILSHPTLLGSFVAHRDAGVAHAVLFGTLQRLVGADAAIYPNHGGRFPFTPDDCRAIAAATAEPLADLAPIFPTPGGGMTLARVAEMRAMYGNDVMYLVGGGLHAPGTSVVESCRRLIALATA